MLNSTLDCVLIDEGPSTGTVLFLLTIDGQSNGHILTSNTRKTLVLKDFFLYPSPFPYLDVYEPKRKVSSLYITLDDTPTDEIRDSDTGFEYHVYKLFPLSVSGNLYILRPLSRMFIFDLSYSSLSLTVSTLIPLSH